jgi:hypothetical protein
MGKKRKRKTAGHFTDQCPFCGHLTIKRDVDFIEWNCGTKIVCNGSSYHYERSEKCRRLCAEDRVRKLELALLPFARLDPIVEAFSHRLISRSDLRRARKCFPAIAGDGNAEKFE